MAGRGFRAGGFRRRADFCRARFSRGRFLAAADFLDFFDFPAGAFFAVRDLTFLDLPILRTI